MTRTNNRRQGRVIRSNSAVDIRNLLNRSETPTVEGGQWMSATVNKKNKMNINQLQEKYKNFRTRTDLVKHTYKLEKHADKSLKLAKKSMEKANKTIEKAKKSIAEEKKAQVTLTRQHVMSIANMLISSINTCNNSALREDLILDVVCHMAYSLKSDQQVTDVYMDLSMLLEDS